MRAGGRVACGALLRGRRKRPAALASSEPTASVAAAIAAAAVAAATLASTSVALSVAATVAATVASAVASAVAATHAVAAPINLALLGAGLGDRQRPASLRQLIRGHRRLPGECDVGGCAGDV